MLVVTAVQAGAKSRPNVVFDEDPDQREDLLRFDEGVASKELPRDEHEELRPIAETPTRARDEGNLDVDVLSQRVAYTHSIMRSLDDVWNVMKISSKVGFKRYQFRALAKPDRPGDAP